MLCVHDLTLTIENNLLCQSLSFSVKPGDLWGITGRNGSGKTTLLTTLAGLRPVYKGRIDYLEKSLKEYTPHTLSRCLGLLFQQQEPLALSVEEAVLLGRHPYRRPFKRVSDNDKQQVEQALRVTDLLFLRKKSLLHLSGGEQRRSAIATLLAQAPRLYLLDEPLNHLDSVYQERIMEHFLALSRTQPVGIMMVLHNTRMIEKYCSHILTLGEPSDASF